MQNLKIKVNSVEESREAQELFFDLGYVWVDKSKQIRHVGSPYLYTSSDGYFHCGDFSSTFNESNRKETTIPQLKDMVVLKRNDPKDATHYRVDGKEYFQTCDKERYYHFQDDCWVLSTWMNYQLLPQLKPIQNNDLPFIDSEESLNDKIASAEEARQANKTVQDTLNERQKQYGCFEDVAHVTQGMIYLMRKCGYDRMPQTHQMSLYMICSKMARIVNGDFNHVDSWHDISGYAQLVEKLVKE